MSPWTADNNSNNKEMTSTVKEEVSRMETTPSPQRLEQALEVFVADLDGLEESLLKFEEALLKFEEALLELEEGALKEGAPEHQNGQNLKLLSPSEVCEELGEESAVVYRKLRSGEIPSLRLGQTLKVRRADLQEYVKGQQHLHLLGEENSFRER
jgi:excisionase family DNA binding protein